MKWVDGECRLSDCLEAMVFDVGPKWLAVIYANDNGLVWDSYDYATEAAAKSAVAAWIGKTMAQFSNALAAGEPRIDEE